MQIRIFTIPSADSGSLQSEMNAFLSAPPVGRSVSSESVKVSAAG